VTRVKLGAWNEKRELEALFLIFWLPGAESNHRHKDLQISSDRPLSLLFQGLKPRIGAYLKFAYLSIWAQPELHTEVVKHLLRQLVDQLPRLLPFAQ
jgi:hypothetical protein